MAGRGGKGDPIFFLHESTRGVELRLHTENQCHWWPGSGLKVCGVGKSNLVKCVAQRLRLWTCALCF